MYDKIVGKAKKDFNVQPLSSESLERVMSLCAQIYAGRPPWLDADDNIKTINFAATLCAEFGRLATLAIGVKVDGSARAEWLQKQIDSIYYKLRHWTEYGCAYGTVIIKPDGESINLFTPNDFIITAFDGDMITGAVFKDEANDGGSFYTRLEYHRFDGDSYLISNRAYVSNSQDSIGDPVTLENSPWAGLEPESSIENLEKPLFAVFKMPDANNVEINSPYALPAFSRVLEELKDLDIAYSRNSKEILDSKRTVLIDSDRLMTGGARVSDFETARKQMGLPDYVRNVFGDGVSSFYQEINPTLNTEARQAGINNLLSQIGFKCGFSNGYFVLNEKTGMITATQVEADDRRTIQTIKDIRDKLECCLNGLLYCLDAYANLYGLAPAGAWKAVYDFGDITYNLEEDKIRWWGYVTANKIPAWYYFVKFEGLPEEDAKELVQEATPSMPALFGGVD